jgi:hypothetical protein
MAAETEELGSDIGSDEGPAQRENTGRYSVYNNSSLSLLLLGLS